MNRKHVHDCRACRIHEQALAFLRSSRRLTCESLAWNGASLETSVDNSSYSIPHIRSARLSVVYAWFCTNHTMGWEPWAHRLANSRSISAWGAQYLQTVPRYTNPTRRTSTHQNTTSRPTSVTPMSSRRQIIAYKKRVATAHAGAKRKFLAST